MDVDAVRQALQTMRSEIARRGFSPHHGDADGPCCFIGGARTSDLDDVIVFLRPFVPLHPDHFREFADSNLIALGLSTESALSIIDAALVALPGHVAAEEKLNRGNK